MQNLATLLLILNLIILAITLINVISVRVVKNDKSNAILEHISILVPLRNESKNVLGVLNSLVNQGSLINYEILVLDDHSTDDTSDLVLSLEAPNLRLIRGAELPEGWLGKTFACHQLAKSAQGDYLVFVDADVRLQPDAIVNTLNLMRKLGWSFISPYPRQIAKSFLERVAQPLLQWSWFATLPLRLAEKTSRPSMIVANGQFLIVQRDAYLKSGGHESIKNEVLDDMELARALVRHNFKGGVADGSKVAECRMYTNGRELIEGYSKSQWRAFGNPWGASAVVTLLFSTSVLPILLGLAGEVLGWYGYFVLVMSRLLVAFKTNSVLSSASLHPISALFWIYLIIISWIRKWRGQLTWRERRI
jgi:glycosyltransferase involved in cell wall biosynthesis